MSSQRGESYSGKPASAVTIDAAYKRVRKAAKAAAQVGQEADEGQEVQEGLEVEHDEDEALHRIRAVYARGTVVPDAGVPDARVSPRPESR
jgi:hypothetical protein